MSGSGMQLVRALDMMAPMEQEDVEWADVDMDMDIDVDVFRPSAMLDRKLEEEFGGSHAMLYNTCFGSDSDDEFVDIEQVLLSSDEFDANPAVSPQKPAHKHHGLPLHPDHPHLVFAKNTAQLPPKYFRGVHCSPHKARVYRRTFGERSQSFAFPRQQSAPPALPSLSSSSPERRRVPSRQCVEYKQPAIKEEPGLVPNDENKRPPSENVDVDMDTTDDNDAGAQAAVIKQEPIAVASPPRIESRPERLSAPAFILLTPTVQTHQPQQQSDVNKPPSDAVTTESPLPPTTRSSPVITLEASKEVIVKSRTSSTALHHQRLDAMVARTPLRRCRSLTTSSSSAVMQTPPVVTSTAQAPTMISPACTYEKLTAVHAKGTPSGKVDQLEWKIRSTTTTHALPPRYRPSEATTVDIHKRRVVHSTTFGAFARSFSFSSLGSD